MNKWRSLERSKSIIYHAYTQKKKKNQEVYVSELFFFFFFINIIEVFEFK